MAASAFSTGKTIPKLLSFNNWWASPGPPYTYQGKCGGWMTSESDDWLGSWTLDAQGNVVLVDDGPETQDGDDKHSLAATSGVGEWHYDVLDGDGVYGYDPGWDTVLPMFGSHNNHGLWYDRDGVDLWQADDWINTGINAPRINTGGLNVIKFYDANANGENDDGQEITGWPINIAGTPSSTPVSSLKLPPGTYTVSESPGGPWMGTTPASVEVTLGCGETKSVAFGNLCLGAGGGLTPGFWSNKNGQALVGLDDLNMLRGLNLRTKAGGDFNPSGYSRLKSWLLKADATNMAYMLSVHLAAMELNVYNGKVTGGALIYAPGTTSANALGFATVTAVMAEANIELGFHELTPAGNEYRAYQEALKNALDKANNNKTFVRPTPCTF